MGSSARGCDLGRGAALGAIAVVTLVVAACSVLVDHDDAQCTSDPDCVKFPGTICQNGGCVTAPTPPEGGILDLDASLPVTCTSTQDCLAEHNNAPWVCRKADGTCVSLLSQDCDSIAGSYTSDDTLLLGAVLPIDGPHASTGLALTDAITLGVDELDFGPSAGLPPTADGGLPRPIAVVLCDESAAPVRAATHLTDDLDVPVILGTGDSASTLAIAQAFPRQELLFSPRATADLSAYSAAGLLWRTCPSYAVEADAITALLTRTIEPSFGRAIRVAILHATDVASTELDARLYSSLQAGDAGDAAATDAGDLIDVSYGDPDDPTNDPPEYGDAIAAVTQMSALPDVIVVLGSTQAAPNVVGGIETNWPPTSNRRPEYVLSSGLQVPELLAAVAANGGPSLAPRILGTAPGSSPSSYSNLASFLVRYRAMFDDGSLPGMFGAAQAYDALYTVAYAATVARNTDLVGIDVSQALGVMLDGGSPTRIDFGPEGIAPAFAALASGSAVSLWGASAPLPFDTATGDVVTDVQVWCVEASSDSSSFVFQNSGLYYAPPSLVALDGGGAGRLEGLFGSGCTL
jgi:ABC-type branched-subunit amino acid transport system substrate-binding protein